MPRYELCEQRFRVLSDFELREEITRILVSDHRFGEEVLCGLRFELCEELLSGFVSDDGFGEQVLAGFMPDNCLREEVLSGIGALKGFVSDVVRAET